LRRWLAECDFQCVQIGPNDTDAKRIAADARRQQHGRRLAYRGCGTGKLQHSHDNIKPKMHGPIGGKGLGLPACRVQVIA
jgi:hypothetical protein